MGYPMVIVAWWIEAHAVEGPENQIQSCASVRVLVETMCCRGEGEGEGESVAYDLDSAG